MDILFLFLAVPFVLHAIGNVYVDHFAAGLRHEIDDTLDRAFKLVD